MSALGQKQTSAPQKGMSALPPKADILSVTSKVALLGCFEKVYGLVQSGLRFGDKSEHNLSDGWDVFNTSRRLARRKQCRVRSASLCSRDNLVF